MKRMVTLKGSHFIGTNAVRMIVLLLVGVILCGPADIRAGEVETSSVATNHERFLVLTDESASVFVGRCRSIRWSGETERYEFEIKEILKGPEVIEANRNGSSNLVIVCCPLRDGVFSARTNELPKHVLSSMTTFEQIVFMEAGPAHGSGAAWLMLKGDPVVAFQRATPAAVAAIKGYLASLSKERHDEKRHHNKEPKATQ